MRAVRPRSGSKLSAKALGPLTADRGLAAANAQTELHRLQLQQLDLEAQNEELRRRLDEQDRSEAYYFNLYDLGPLGHLTLGESGVILRCNQTAATLLGLRGNELLGRWFGRLVLPQDQDRFQLLRAEVGLSNQPQSVELRLLREGGEPFWARLQCRAQRGVGETERDIVLHDISERKLGESALHQLAFYDQLTQLPNRRLLDDRLQQAIAASRRSRLHSALMFVDLDNFKPLNDLHGHAAGDLLLAQVAARLTACVREIDTVARFGGDEFVVILGELGPNRAESTQQTLQVAEKIRLQLAAPYHLALAQTPSRTNGSVVHHCSASIGLVVFGDGEASQDEILRWADAAMYQAKQHGKNAVRLHAP